MRNSYSRYDVGYGEDGDVYDVNYVCDERHNLLDSTDHKANSTDLKQQGAAWQADKGQ